MERRNLNEVVRNLMMQVFVGDPPLNIREYTLCRNYYNNRLLLNKCHKPFIQFRLNGLDLIITDKRHKTTIDIYYEEDDTKGSHIAYLQPLYSELEDILNKFEALIA